jgi:hypothetical protein
MPLTAICGYDFRKNMGNLKSYFMTLNGYLNYRNGSKVFANYKLNFPYTPITSLKELSEELDDLNNATVLLDEITIYFDQYMRPSKKNGTSAFKNFARQTRKRKIKIYMTAQSLSDINIALRRVTENIWMTSKLHPDYTICNDDQCHGDHLIEVQNNRVVYNGLQPLGNPKYFKVVKKIFDLYDTEQIIDIID